MASKYSLTRVADILGVTPKEARVFVLMTDIPIEVNGHGSGYSWLIDPNDIPALVRVRDDYFRRESEILGTRFDASPLGQSIDCPVDAKSQYVFSEVADTSI